MTDGASAEIAAALRESRKYGCLCEDTLRRVARWAASRHARTKDAVKAAKRKLHQACGAYLGGFDPAEAGAVARGLPNDPPRDVLRDACLGVLGRHVSTAERAPFMEEAYAEMFRRTGTPRVLVDVACGLNPFAFPWMGLPREVTYHALDIDGRIVSAADAFFARLGMEHSAACSDVLVSVPNVEADVALLLKTLPGLERQEKGAGARVLKELRARHVVVSFPVGSLGGRKKGMHAHYRGEMSRLADGLGVSVEEIAFPGETFYVLTKA